MKYFVDYPIFCKLDVKFLCFICTLCFNFLSLNLTITLSRFDIQWHACRSLGTTSWPVNDKALHIVSSRTLSWISWDTGFNSRVSLLWYCALLTAFFSNWTIREYNREVMQSVHRLLVSKLMQSLTCCSDTIKL